MASPTCQIKYCMLCPRSQLKENKKKMFCTSCKGDFSVYKGLTTECIERLYRKEMTHCYNCGEEMIRMKGMVMCVDGCDLVDVDEEGDNQISEEPDGEKIAKLSKKPWFRFKKDAAEAVETLLSIICRSIKRNELRILVTGKTGQGKSTLINGILGAKVAIEGACSTRCTTRVEMYSKTINGVPIKVFDSPGLQDSTENEEEYIQGMRDTCQELSLILYCTKMINTRLTDDDKNAMRKLTEAFGESFWKYAVFVLTFANMEDVTRKDDRDELEDEEEPHESDDEAWKQFGKKIFEGRLKIWGEELQHFLIKEIGVSSKIAKGIPVVPTGDNKKSRSNTEFLRLPDRENWFNKFWEVCCLRVKETQLFLKVNSDRMIAEQDSDESDDNESDSEEISRDEKILPPEDKLVEELQRLDMFNASNKVATDEQSSSNQASGQEEIVEVTDIKNNKKDARHLIEQNIHIQNEFARNVMMRTISCKQPEFSGKGFQKLINFISKPGKMLTRLAKGPKK